LSLFSRVLQHFETAFFIFQRRLRIAQSREILSYVEKVVVQENQLHEHELVCFFYDAYTSASKKVLKLKQGEGFYGTITRKWKGYQNFVDLIPLFTKNKINPFSFFTFTIEARRNRKIPFTIRNTCTQNSVDHYLRYLKSNTYRVSTYSNFKDYEETLYNQLNIDLISLGTYLLRKPRISINSCESFLFSSFTKVLLSLNKTPVGALTQEESVFYEDLMFAPEFLARVQARWNQSVDRQIEKIGGMINTYMDQNFVLKIGEIVKLLEVLKFT
jgi:hypothetical protein